MRQDSWFNRRAYPVLFMLATTVVCILPIALLAISTETRVEENQAFFLRKAVLDATALAHDGSASSVASVFAERVTAEDGIWKATGPDGSQRFALQASGPGLWGEISIIAGFENDGSTFSGVAIVSHSETPGLGARIEEPWFTEQFKGQREPFKLVEEGTADASGEIDAITGATRTSEAFLAIIDQAAKEGLRITRGR